MEIRKNFKDRTELMLQELRTIKAMVASSRETLDADDGQSVDATWGRNQAAVAVMGDVEHRIDMLIEDEKDFE
ncbi:hypothetical protein DSCW_35680 [Desulfosarcina widdelii]|uniref:Uncharacterized protein n=1 Tax=Desulfosarcina widdelii TaxID=947919 RepID=A0A5K7Z8X2_9BACT|nr:hypothetical protein [Desulfosarcina widdelii]BBO76151.1 hypothetical protein DSCW_35680 [Desulfosarcina widdelii]